MSLTSSLAAVSLALQVQATPPDPSQSFDLPAVQVEGRLAGMDLETRIDDFVESVAGPVGDFGPARWHRDVCVGAVNFQPAAAQAIVDRVSQVAGELGLRAEEPGCSPDVLIVATNEGPGTAAGLVARNRRLFVIEMDGSSLGEAALRRFQTNDRPIRWWHNSLPVDADLGHSIQRRRGGGAAEGPLNGLDSLIIVDRFVASRLFSERRDNLIRAVILVDTTRLGEASFAQVAEYVAMVSMAQVDPEVQVTGHDSILNLFAAPGGPDGLTEWDMAYLRGLYDARLDTSSQVARLGAVEAAMEQLARDASAD